MSDLISRQQVIDATWEEPSYADPLNVLTEVRDRIKALPPAQPESLVNESRPLVKDTISRQAAIDYFVTNVGFHDEDGYPIEDECELREIWTGYFDGIPSAQPEPLKIDLSGYSEEDWERFRKEWANVPIMALPKMGRWERHYSRPNVYADLFWHCSACGYKSSDGWANKFNFCPNCGAKMEGADDE